MMIRSLALFAHVIGVLSLFGALVAEWLSLEALRRSHTDLPPPFSVSILRALPRYTGIASGLILISGIFLATRAGVWEFAWVRVSFVAMVLMGVLGGTGLRPLMRDLGQPRSSEQAATRPDVRQRASHPYLQLSF